MDLHDWMDAAVAISTIYFGWQQNQIFKRQNEILAAQGGVAMPPDELRLAKLKRYWPMLVMTVLMLLTWGGVVYGHYDRHINGGFEDIAPSAVRTRQTFRNQEVELDGIRYTECIFENLTFVFNAKRPYQLLGNQFLGTNTLRTDSKEAAATIGLMVALGMINPNSHLDIPGIRSPGQ